MSISRLLVSAFLTISAQSAIAADSLDGAIIEKAQQSALGFAEAGAIQTAYSFLYSKPVLNKGLLGATVLDDAIIAKVVARVETSFFPTLGVREFGGARVVITTDLAQVANSAGLRNIDAALAARKVALPVGAPLTQAEIKLAAQALVTELSPTQFKPKFGKTVINLRTANLAQELASLKAVGALVQEIEVKTLIPRLGGYAVAAFNVVLIGGASLDALTAGNYALQSQYPEASAAWKYMNCDEGPALQSGETTYTNCAVEPNWVKKLMQNSPFALVTAIMPD